MKLEVRRDEQLPRLAWFATIEPLEKHCVVEVGPMVEVDGSANPKWVVSGMWTGPFEAGRFHREEYLFGSGLRLDEDGVHVVPASTTVERCVYARDAGIWYASNSLVVLLGRLGASIDVRFDHRDWGESMALGINNYVRQFHVMHPRIPMMSQLIYETLRIGFDGTASYFVRDRLREFKNYDDYIAQLTGVMRQMLDNATSKARARPMRSVTSASRGYDSSTVTALIAPMVPGITSWSAERSNTRIPAIFRGLMKTDVSDDDGSEIARQLGATPRYLDLHLSNLGLELESWCWATAQISPELVFHSLLDDAETQSVPTVFWAGHVGDGAWEKTLGELGLSGQIIRGAQSGYSLIEARVRYGIIEASVPYVFMRSVRSINAVSKSDEMKQWHLNNDYDRPIPRRILEQRGVPREAFGWGKKAVAQDFESPQGHELREVFFDSTRWSETLEQLYRGLNFGIYFVQRGTDFIRARGDRGKLTTGMARRFGKRALSGLSDLQRQTFFITTHLLAKKYART